MKRLSISTAIALLVILATQPSAQASFGFSSLTLTDAGASDPAQTASTLWQTNTVNSAPGPLNHSTGSTRGITETFVITDAQSKVTGDASYDKAALLNIYVKLVESASVSITPTQWTLTLGHVNTGTNTIDNVRSMTPTSATVITVAKHNYIQFALGDSNYVELANGTYFFSLATTGGADVSIDSTDTPNGTGGGLAAKLTGYTAGSTISYPGSGAFTYTIDTTPVPEPADWAWVPVIGTVAVLGFRRWRALSHS